MEEAILTQQSLYDKKQIISLNKFIFLNLITMGLYSVWWVYKSWKVFQEREQYEELMPVWRTLFGVIFYYNLFQRILGFAESKGYQKEYSSGYLLVGIIFFVMLSWLPYPYSLVTVFDFVFFIPPFLALNYALENSDEYEEVVTSEKFNDRQIALVVLGSALWLCEIYVIVVYPSHG
jgi:hypothetical protein